jgi:putative ABC transport system permease protein
LRNADLSAELEFHLAREIEENIASGMSPEDAAAAARAAFGSMTATTEECYEARGTAWIDQLVQDCRFGTRSLVRHRSFSAVTILTLALGIGTCTAVFSLADAVLFRSLPYSKPEQLVYLYTPSQQLLHVGFPANVFNPSYADFSDLRKQSHSFSAMSQYQQTSMNLAAGRQVERVGVARVDTEFFKTLAVDPEIGRAFDPAEEKQGSGQVAVISHAVWMNMFGGTGNALGGRVVLDGITYRVVGVMPEGFAFPRNDDLPAGFGNFKSTEIWIPLALRAKQTTCRDYWCAAFALGRLRSGITPAATQQELTTIMTRLDPLHAGSMHDLVAAVDPMRDAVIGPVRLLMRLLVATVGVVLLIVCANAASLLLARAAERTYELGVRAALGAQRERLLRQIMTESLLLCLMAALAGSGLAWLLLRAVRALNPGDIPRLQDAALDVRAFAVTAATAILIALFVGAIPSIVASRVDLRAFLASGGTRGLLGGRKTVRRILAVAQIAIVVILLTGAGLLLRSYLKVLASPTGYPLSTISASIQFSSPLSDVPSNPRYDTPEKRRQSFAEILHRLRHSPGVEAAGVIDVLPLSGSEMAATSLEVEGHPAEQHPWIEIRRVSPDWFASMRIPLLAGRDFVSADGSDRPGVAVVNKAFAARYLDGERAIGQHIRFSSDSPWTSVVGIVDDVRIYRPEDAPAPQMYICLWQADASSGYLTLRSHLTEQTATAEIRTIVRSFDPAIAVADMHTLSDLEKVATARRRFQTTLMMSFSVMGMVLALVGVYGLLAYSVSQRTAEIGIRMAMGSGRLGIVNLVLIEGLMLLAAGLVIGLAGALAATHVVSDFLYQTPKIDPITYALVPSLLLLGTLTACIFPSYRAARIDPMHVLRRE